MNTKYDDEEQMKYLKQWQLNKKQKEEVGMFKNCVLKPDVDTAKWFKAACIRAIKTIAQTAIATIGASATMGEVNWAMVGSASLLAGVVSVLTSIAGIPEVPEVKEGD